MNKKDARSIKEKLEGNVFWVIISSMIIAGVAVGGTVYGVMNYFEGVKIANAVYECNNKLKEYSSILSSLDRGVSDNNFYDVRNFLVSKSKGNFSDNKSNYFEKEKFYSQKANDIWDYRIDSTIDSRILTSYDSLFAVHFWTHKKATEPPNNKVKEKLEVTITLEVYKSKTIAKMYEVGVQYAESFLNKNSEKTENPKNDDNKDADEFLSFTKDYYMNDLISKYAISTVSFQMSMFMYTHKNNGKIRINKLQKVENVFYCQTLSESKVVESENNATGIVYNKIEHIFINANNNLYFITIQTPSLEPLPNKEKENDITFWLSNFKIVVD